MMATRRSELWTLRVVAVFAMLTTPIMASTTAAASDGLGATASAGKLRTPQEMLAFDTDHSAPATSFAVPFLPTMDIADYLAAKAAAAAAPRTPKETEGAAPAAPPTQGAANCAAIGQGGAGGAFPPDTHGAVGANHYVQVVNQAVRVYSKSLTGSCPTSILLTVSLNGFFGYFGAALFDPRVVYDMSFDRWIITAEGFPEGGAGSNQFHFVAVSQTGNPAGSFFIYPFEMRFLLGLTGSSNTSFWDFPQLGYDEEAIIVTGNVFDPGYSKSVAFFLAKARMYRGLGFSFCLFDQGAEGTIAPPIVLDQSPVTALATSRVGANRIRLTKYTATSRVCPRGVETVDLIPSKTLSVPPLAPQPGTAQVIDTSDARFVNASTQFGEPAFGQPIRLWQTATLGTGFAIPRFYQINANVAGSSIETECNYFASSTSFDFNASIAANLSGTVFITYSSTDTSVNPQVRFTGKKFGDACSTLGAPGGVLNAGSPSPLTGNFDPNFGAQRWGDYSAVTIDPTVQTRAWAVNEKVKAGGVWKSRFFNMDNP